MLDGTLRLKSSLALFLRSGDNGAQPALGSGAGNHDDEGYVDETGASTGPSGEDLHLVSCAAAVTCGGPEEASSIDGTANVSRLVPFNTAGDANGLQQVRFGAR